MYTSFMTDDRVKTLVEQLNIHPNTRIWVGGNCMEAKRAIAPCLAPSSRPAQGTIDVVIITPESTEEALYFVNKLRNRLDPEAIVWVVFSEKIQQLESKQHFFEAMEQSGWIEINKISINDSFIAFGYALPLVDQIEPE